jgi:hypothetical protein
MKLSTLLVTLTVFALALLAGPTTPSDITVTCGSTQSTSNNVTCPAGVANFSGTDFHHSHVTVTGDVSGTIDDSGYAVTDGVLSVDENLSTPDTYSVTIKTGGHVINLTVTTN